MLQVNDIVEVEAEKMLFSDSALARVDGIPIFIDGACPKDKLKIKITKINKNYMFGEIIDIVSPSPNRTKPFCPMFNVCGSCSWQHISYIEQLKQKQNIVKETFKKIANIDLDVPLPVQSEKQTEYRVKAQFPIAQTKVSKRVMIGYYKKNSHELVNIKFCPVQKDIVNKINEFIREKTAELSISAYNEKKKQGVLKHVVFKYSFSQNRILIIFSVNTNSPSKELKTLAKSLFENFKEVIGVCFNYNTMHNNVILSDKTETIEGQGYYYEKVSDKTFRVSANSFFQVNPFVAEKIFNFVKEEITQRFDKPTILDAYSGVSTFGIILSDIAKNVVCIEEVKHATEDAKENVKLNNCKNVEIISDDATKIFNDFKKTSRKFDVVVVDPPRKGCGEQVVSNLVQSASKMIVYTSCDVATLARDTKQILQNGFKLAKVQPFDMFPNTYHIENVAIFEKI